MKCIRFNCCSHVRLLLFLILGELYNTTGAVAILISPNMHKNLSEEFPVFLVFLTLGVQEPSSYLASFDTSH